MTATLLAHAAHAAHAGHAGHAGHAATHAAFIGVALLLMGAAAALWRTTHPRRRTTGRITGRVTDRHNDLEPEMAEHRRHSSL